MDFIYFDLISLLISALTSVLFFLGRTYLRGLSMKIIFFYILLCGFTDVTTSIMTLFHQSNLNVMNIFSVIQFVLLMLFLFTLLEVKSIKWVLVGVLIVIGSYSSIYIYNNYTVVEFAWKAMAIQNTALILFAAITLLSITFKIDNAISREPLFWFLSAMLIYFSLSTMAIVTSEVKIEAADILRKYTWFLNSIGSIISNLLYLLGLRCLKTQTKLSLPSI